MKSLKSLFVSGFISLAVFTTGMAFWQLFTGGGWPWAVLLLTCVPSVGFFSYLFVWKPARTSENLPTVFWPTLLGTLAVISLALAGQACVVMVTLAILNLLGVHAYIRWYSRYGTREANVALGEPLPGATFTNLEGKPVTVADYAGQPMVMLFFRGNWCPLCMAQIREVAAQYQSLQAQGVRVALISPQSHSQSADLAKQFQVDFEYLRDDNNQAARALGIVDAGGTPAGLEALGYDSDTVMPTVFIVDVEGRLVYQHLTDNYRVRPEPDLFIQVLREKGLIDS
ncbi:MAG: peroxiredoxin family protein [Alloalcanivorax sp.]